MPICAAGNSNGCAVAGIEQATSSNVVTIYPNPASTILNVECLMVNGTNQITMYDMLGVAIFINSVAIFANYINLPL
ncbi:MAG TPA: hypothetical protein VF411_08605 [Bacteroidia bacterium]